MARRRMFSLTIVDTDNFLEMPPSTQALYFHLGMRADDDGFVASPKKIIKLCNCGEDDLKILITKEYIYPFDNGVIVIADWKENNYIQRDRYIKTKYQDELKKLTENNNRYDMDTKCIQNVYKSDTQDRLGKDRLGKVSIEKKTKETFVSVIDSYTENEELKEALQDYVEMRKKEKGFTLKALKLCIKKLDTLAIDEITKKEIVNQSIERSWKTFYPLNENQYNKNTSKDFIDLAKEYESEELFNE